MYEKEKMQRKYNFKINHKLRNIICTSEILNTAHLTPIFRQHNIHLVSLPANTNTNEYCVPKTGFKREFLRFLMYKYK